MILSLEYQALPIYDFLALKLMIENLKQLGLVSVNILLAIYEIHEFLWSRDGLF